jgi:hypothetical protein
MPIQPLPRYRTIVPQKPDLISYSGGDFAMQHTAPVLLPLDFIVSRIDFLLLRWIIHAHLKRLSLAAFHPHPLRQRLSSRFLGKV